MDRNSDPRLFPSAARFVRADAIVVFVADHMVTQDLLDDRRHRDLSEWIALVGGHLGSAGALLARERGDPDAVRAAATFFACACADTIRARLDDEFIPVVATIGTDDEGQAFNINADTVAGAIAEALGAEKLVYLTDIEGLRRVVDDPASLIRQTTPDELDELMADGTIAGGMIPKVESCVSAVRSGVRRAHILDGRIAHVLLLEIFTDEGIGTMVQ